MITKKLDMAIQDQINEWVKEMRVKKGEKQNE